MFPANDIFQRRESREREVERAGKVVTASIFVFRSFFLLIPLLLLLLFSFFPPRCVLDSAVPIALRPHLPIRFEKRFFLRLLVPIRNPSFLDGGKRDVTSLREEEFSKRRRQAFEGTQRSGRADEPSSAERSDRTQYVESVYMLIRPLLPPLSPPHVCARDLRRQVPTR